jgi:hypothetical protein
MAMVPATLDRFHLDKKVALVSWTIFLALWSSWPRRPPILSMAMYSLLIEGGLPPKNPDHLGNSPIQNVSVFEMDRLLNGKDL